MGISDAAIRVAVADYLNRVPGDKGVLAECIAQLARGSDLASRRTFPMHVTVGALVVRGDGEVLLVNHRAYGGILLQPGGHLESEDDTLVGGAVRELVEEVGVDPRLITPTSPHPVYIEHGRVPARPEKDEPEHFHLDIGFAFSTVRGDIGDIQASEVTGAAWYPIAVAERRVGDRIARADPASIG